jgi:hypothetical protein
MQILYKSQEISGFTATHLPCPCGEHHGCYSQRADGSGLCFSCGKNHPANNRTTYAPPPTAPQRTAPVLHTVADAEIFPSTLQVPKSPFCRTCEAITGAKPESHYYLGAFGNDVIFWVRDFERVVRNKKTLRFHANGFNRRKDVHPHTLTGVFTPFWGEEHLQTFVNTSLTDVFFIESEKTVIYCQHTFRWALWLGCGGSNGCTRGKIERVKHLLSEKRLFVLFDNDTGGESGTETALRNFQRCGLSANTLSVSDLFPQAPNGTDLADCILSGSGVQL